MALVCDIKSSPSADMPPSEKPPVEENVDLEDGEITDDDDDDPAIPEPSLPEPPMPTIAGAQPTVPPTLKKSQGNTSDSDSYSALIKETGEPPSREKSSDRCSDDKDRHSDGRERDRTTRNREGKKGKEKNKAEGKAAHRKMTEAERSILHLRKREKMLREREKWERQHRKEVDPTDDDFAKTIEKTLATILNKKEKEAAALSAGEEPPTPNKEEEKRGKKRKKEDKDKSKSKHRRLPESPRSDIDENEMLNIRSGSPGGEMRMNLSALPYGGPALEHRRSRSHSRSEESFNSEFSSDEREERARRKAAKTRRKKEQRERNRRERDQRRQNREEASKMPLQDSQGVCVFYLQGKCQKNDCPYSHEVTPPMKLELCKFYLMECCAKGENCLYMHSDFPCKFYHTGLKCTAGKDCKFAHGGVLSDGLKQILFKHIETAPRDILQGFPRLSRDEALNLINQTQKKLTEQHGGGPSSPLTSSSFSAQGSGGPGMYKPLDDRGEDHERDKEATKEVKMPKNERNRNKQSRWQEPESGPPEMFPVKGFPFNTDQDMRVLGLGNGDIDMRTLPALPSLSNAAVLSDTAPSGSLIDPDEIFQKDIDIRATSNLSFTMDVDIRQSPMTRYNAPPSMDVDIRNFHDKSNDDQKKADQNSQNLQAAVDNFELPQTTRDLLARITATQKDNTLMNVQCSAPQAQSATQSASYEADEQNINWYSDDDDDDENRLTIKVEDEESHKRERGDDCISTSTGVEPENKNSDNLNSSFLTPSEFSAKTVDIVGKLGDLSKIDISAEVTKLLSSMSQNKTINTPEPTNAEPAPIIISKSEESLSPKASTSVPQDPRVARHDPRLSQDPRLSRADPRQRARQSSIEDKKEEKLSIYEQGGLDMKKAALEIDGDDFKGSLRPDIDLRSLALPFKGMQNYTPATEIDASINSHPHMTWKVHIVEVPRPDYTGLKLSINDAEKTGDPRLRKIFRLSVDEKDSPASPKASPRQNVVTRIDPRLRKMEEKSQESPQMPYNQQLTMLQSSQFYQSLTSHQKLMLNQELARNDQSGGGGTHDPLLNSLLSSLNLLPANPLTPPPAAASLGPNTNMGTAMSILANVTKMNPLLPSQPLIGQQGLLGAAPGIPNIPQGMPPQDFPMNFDPRNGGLLGNPPPHGGFGGQFGGYNDDFYGGYEEQGNNMMVPQGGNFRQGRGYNGGRRRGNRDNFRGGRGNRNFKRGGGRDNRGDRMERDRDGNRGNRGYSP